MTLKFANPRLEAADTTLRVLRDGKWHVGYDLGLRDAGPYLVRLRMVERRVAPPISTRGNGARRTFEYRITEAGKVLAEVFANLRGTDGD